MMLVSVYIPTKDRPESAFKAVQSVLNQTYQNLEVILVDDHSSPENFAKLSGFFEGVGNLTICRNTRAPGACGARNTALIQAKGVFVTGLDDDDAFVSTRIEELVHAYERYSVPICTNYLEIDEKSGRRRELVLREAGEIDAQLLAGANVVGNQLFALRQDYLAAGMFDEEQLCWQDYDLWMRILQETGQIRKIDSTSYLISISATRPRITNNASRASGILRFIDKHKLKLTEENAFHHWLSYYERNPNQKIGAHELVKALRLKSSTLLLKKVIKKRAPNLHSYLMYRK